MKPLRKVSNFDVNFLIFIFHYWLGLFILQYIDMWHLKNGLFGLGNILFNKHFIQKVDFGTYNFPEELVWELSIFLKGWFGNWKYSWGVYVGAGNIHKEFVWELAIFMKGWFRTWTLYRVFWNLAISLGHLFNE